MSAKYGLARPGGKGAKRPPEAEAATVKISSAQVSVITEVFSPNIPVSGSSMAAWIEIRYLLP
jgi:hypothetical protein